MNQYARLKQTGSGAKIACDLRSDSVTRPDPAMREALAGAVVGDDVYGEDPTVLRLQEDMAARLGKEAALFFPTGTQSNLAALMVHCGRGDEAIVGDYYHIFRDEAAGASVLGGISLCPVPTETDGAISAETVTAAFKADDPHYARTRLLCLENTVGGTAIGVQQLREVSALARARGLKVHLDGARFFNAVRALNCKPEELGGVADTVSVCLSKGLGAPAGSVLAGDAASIGQARRHRKILGGGMRQSGVLAAAGLHALEHNISALDLDHRRAERLGEGLRALDAGNVRVCTNMVYFTPAAKDLAPLGDHMAANGILIGGQSPAIRLVLHRDVDDGGLDQAIEGFRSYFRAL